MSVDRVREIVIRHGWNTTSYQILNPGLEYWFSPAHDAVIGYTVRGGVLLVAGGPVCPWESLESVCAEFESFAAGQGRSVCYVCAEQRLQSLFDRSPDHAIVVLGAQPVWNPHGWPELVRGRRSLRAQLSRAKNKGVVVEEVTADRAAADPELRRILDEWLRARALPPLHFLVEPNVLDSVLIDRFVLVAKQHGRHVAFLVASPAKARNGYLVELLARSGAAANGTSELLIDAAMRRAANEGCQYVTLGLVALARAADDSIRQNPGWLRSLMYFARAHANRFYNFRGLEQFRVKMAPERWETVYAVSNEPRFSPWTFYALGGAFSGIPPWAAIALGIGRAAVAEVRGLVRTNSPPAAAGDSSETARARPGVPERV